MIIYVLRSTQISFLFKAVYNLVRDQGYTILDAFKEATGIKHLDNDIESFVIQMFDQIELTEPMTSVIKRLNRKEQVFTVMLNTPLPYLEKYFHDPSWNEDIFQDNTIRKVEI